MQWGLVISRFRAYAKFSKTPTLTLFQSGRGNLLPFSHMGRRGWGMRGVIT